MNNSNSFVFLSIPESRYSIDFYTLWAIHVILFIIFLVFSIKDLRAWYKTKTASKRKGTFGNATVNRSERSMNGLFTIYAVITLIFSLAIQVVDYWKDCKATFIIIDYCILTYLFFFSSRFRNDIVFRIFNRIQKD